MINRMLYRLQKSKIFPFKKKRDSFTKPTSASLLRK